MATAAETFKTTTDQFTTAGAQAFRDSVEKTLAGINDVNAYSKANLEAVVASVTAATKGAESLGSQAIAFSKKSVEDQVAAAKTLAGAKSVQEAVELQTTFAKSALEAYLANLNAMSETVTASMKDVFKPINARAAAVVEKVQAAR
jgi:phasin family protein